VGIELGVMVFFGSPPRSDPLIEHDLRDKRVLRLREENRCPLFRVML